MAVSPLGVPHEKLIFLGRLDGSPGRPYCVDPPDLHRFTSSAPRKSLRRCSSASASSMRWCRTGESLARSAGTSTLSLKTSSFRLETHRPKKPWSQRIGGNHWRIFIVSQLSTKLIYSASRGKPKTPALWCSIYLQSLAGTAVF